MEYEKIIGTALLTGDHDKALRQITCKTAAMTRMVCGCGNVHDEQKIRVIEIVHADGTEQTIAALCPDCCAKNMREIQIVAQKATALHVEAGQEPPIVRVATWAKFIVIKGA